MVAMAVSRNTGATASWMTRLMSVRWESMGAGGLERGKIRITPDYWQDGKGLESGIISHQSEQF
jgi:hypothetical protein